MVVKIFSCFLGLFLMAIKLNAQEYDLVGYVNSLQGTTPNMKLTRGNTYPTTALPFGMHTWTLQTGEK